MSDYVYFSMFELFILQLSFKINLSLKYRKALLSFYTHLITREVNNTNVSNQNKLDIT